MNTPQDSIIRECEECIRGWSSQELFAPSSHDDYANLIIVMNVPCLSTRLEAYIDEIKDDAESLTQFRDSLNAACVKTYIETRVSHARDTVCQRIATQITDARESQGLTITKAAELSMIPRSHLSRIESATYKDTSVRTIAAIAAALGIKITI